MDATPRLWRALAELGLAIGSEQLGTAALKAASSSMSPLFAVLSVKWVCVRDCLVRAQSSRAADGIGLRALGGAGDGLVGAGGGCCVRRSHGLVALSRLGRHCCGCVGVGNGAGG